MTSNERDKAFKSFPETAKEKRTTWPDLVKKFNPKKCYMNFIIELVNENLNGRENVGPGIDITTLIQI